MHPENLAIGTLGYVRAGLELHRQLLLRRRDLGEVVRHVLCRLAEGRVFNRFLDTADLAPRIRELRQHI